MRSILRISVSKAKSGLLDDPSIRGAALGSSTALDPGSELGEDSVADRSRTARVQLDYTTSVCFERYAEGNFKTGIRVQRAI